MSAEWWWGIVGSVFLAGLAFVFGRVNLASATRLEREEDLRRRRVDTYAAFCVSVIEYRRAQLHRWYVGQDVGGPELVEQQRPEVSEDVRSSRAAAWGRFYEVVMICDDAGVVGRAERALELTRSMKRAPDAARLNAVSDQVHDAVREFATYAGRTVLASGGSELSPPREWVGEGGAAAARET